jgi:hypothetical protein
MGTQLATISLHDLAGERPLTSETFAMLPTFAPSVGVCSIWSAVYPHARASGELWSVTLTNGQKGANVSRTCNGSYSISPDARKLSSPRPKMKPTEVSGLPISIGTRHPAN